MNAMFTAIFGLFFTATLSAAPIDAPVPLEAQPFGALTLVDEIDTSLVAPNAQLPVGASGTATLLGRTARTLAMSTVPKAMSYRIGQNKGLVAGAAYVLEIEYPDDVPRTLFIANRGADFVRGFSTGTAIGDVRFTYTPTTLESLNYPQSQSWKSYRQLFVLHERTSVNFNTQRNQMCALRSLLPADGFDVVMFQSYDRNDPRSVGTAVGKIKLWRVNAANIAGPNFTPLPDALQKRHLYWREEMADEAAIGDTETKRAFVDPLNWFDAKMTLAIALGFDTIGKDLLEWGHNQGWDSLDQNWVNNPGPPAAMSNWKTIWSRIVERAGQRGLNVIPYYEYSGSIGQCGASGCGGTYKSLGTQRRVSRLFAPSDGWYTGIPWTEDSAVDITDPDAVTDFRKMLEYTITAHASKANFLGAWVRTRQTDMPISFSAATLARYNAANPAATRTLQQLRDDAASRDAYYAWWYGQRKNYLTGLRDYLRQSTGNNQMQVLFAAYPQETVPNSYATATGSYVNLVTDDPNWWSAYRGTLNDNWFQYNWYTTSPTNAVQGKIHDFGLKRFLPAVAGSEEMGHSAPPADPERYANESGVAMNYPFGTGLFTVSDAATLSRFSNGDGGQFLTKHYPLNEDNGGPTSLEWSWTSMSCSGPYAVENVHPFRGIVGYTSVAVDREGAHSMLAEARALANGNPFHVAYLESSSFSRGFPEYVRRFSAALRSLPAVASTTVANATTTPDIVVRAYATSTHGTYFAVINTALNAKTGVVVTLPGTGAVTDLLSSASLASNELRFDLYPGEVRTFKLASSSTPAASIALTASPSSITVGQSTVLTATPTVSNTSVTSVEFFSGSTLVGTDTTAPYTLSVSPAVTTSYTVRVNTTTAGLTATSSSVTVTVSTPAATITLAASPSSITVGQSTVLTATPTVSNTSVGSVEFFSGSTLVGTDTTSPYTLSVSPATTTSYTARVNTTTAGLIATSSAVNVTVSAATLTISGKVHVAGSTTTGLAGASLCVSGSGITCTVPDSEGNYSCALAKSGWSGSIHPQVAGKWVGAQAFTNVTSSVAANFAAIDGTCALDIDKNGVIEPQFDGVAILRRMSGYAASSFSGLSGRCATATTTSALHANAEPANLNVSGGSVLSTVDGLILMRAMRGLKGDAVTAGTAANTTNAATWFAGQCGGALQIATNAAAPTLVVTSVNANRVDLSWTAVNGATGYDIERATQNGRFVSHATVGAAVSAFVDEARNTTTGSAPNLVVLSNIVTAGTRYSYRVRARTASGVSDWALASATTTGDTLSASRQDAIEFRYSKLASDSAFQYAPMNALFALVYVPPSYFEAANANRSYPVVIFRHGLGQFGNGRAELTKQYAAAASGTPPYNVANDSGFRPDLIIVSPQLAWNFDEFSGEEERLMAGLRNYIETHYRVLPDAINVTGLSAGTGPVVIHATRGGLPLASWSVVSNQGWGSSMTTSGWQRAASIPSWHAANLGSGGDASSQNTLVTSLIANGGALSASGGVIQSHYFCNTPAITTTDPGASCTSGGGHNAWGKAYSATNAYQSPNYWQWVAQRRAVAP